MSIATFTFYTNLLIWRIRTVGSENLIAAFATGHPPPVVGPSAAAVLEAAVTAAASPSELAYLAAVATEAHEGITGSAVELLAGTM